MSQESCDGNWKGIISEILAASLLPCRYEVDQMATVDLIPLLFSFVGDRAVQLTLLMLFKPHSEI